MVTFRPIFILAAAAALLGACNGSRPPERAAVAVAGPVHFLHQDRLPPAAPAQIARGVLNVDGQGCLRLNDRALLWPAEAALDLSEPGAVRVFSRQEGASVRVGQSVALLASPQPGPLPGSSASVCPGPQLAVARITPAG